MRIRAFVFSAWSELIPVMYSLFVLLRPRRFVELRVQNGMSFFAACQVVERLNLRSECIAIDSWIGDEHAGIHGADVFDQFRAYLQATCPDQEYIQAYFAATRECFEDASIDLLHIDGLHTYEAVKEDFETWLPKLSDVGVVIFHDINVHERGFGVWRLWSELRLTYPAYGVRAQARPRRNLCRARTAPIYLRHLSSDRYYGTLVQAFFENIGELLVGQRADAAVHEQAIAEIHRQLAASQEEAASARAQLTELSRTLDSITRSTTWRAMAPVRHALNRFPVLRRVLRRT
jgi:hypothetical protein